MMRLRHAVALAATLSACTLGPDYQRPTLDVPRHFKEASPPWQEARPQAAAVKGNWWELFNDPALNALQQRARAQNQDAKAAYARVSEADALADVSRSAFFPSASADASGERAQVSGNRAVTTSAPVAQTRTTSYSLLLDLDYQLDIWGRLSRLAESAEARAEAERARFENTLLVLQADVAQNYYTIRADDAKIEALKDGVRLRDSERELVDKRFKGKIASAIDVAQAETQLFTVQSELLAAEKSRAASEHALAVLLGEPPASFSFAPAPLDNAPPLVIPAGLPSTLLERRPDIAVAEKAVVASNAEIGAAIGAFFPAVSLSGDGGFNSRGLHTLFAGDSVVWSIMPGLSLPIFNGGLNEAELKHARAAYTEAVAAYRQQLLGAFQQVEDALSDSRLLAEQYEVQRKAVAAADATQRLAAVRYQTGVDTYLNVADAEVTALEARLTLVDIQRQRYAASTALIVALGGGWR